MWRYYLGGALRDDQYLAADVDGDGQVEIVYVGPGQVIAKRLDDTPVWRSAAWAPTSLVDIWDVDGDGTLDVVAYTYAPAGVSIFSGKDGSLEWSLPSGSIGTVSSIRAADLDGDGRRDLEVFECGNCTILGADQAVAYTFAGGFAGARQMFSITRNGSSGMATIADIDGDGAVDIALPESWSTLDIYNGQTGALKYTLSDTIDLNSPVDAAPVFGDRRNELVQFENMNGPGTREKRLVAYGFDPTTGAIAQRWQNAAGTDPVNDQLVSVPQSLTRFDTSGAWQIAYSAYDGTAKRWSLNVVDAASGAVEASQSDAKLVGVADVDGDGLPELLAKVGTEPIPDSTPVTVFKVVFSPPGTDGGVARHLIMGGVTPTGGSPVSGIDRTLLAWKGFAQSTEISDVNGDGKPEVLFETNDSPPVYEAVDLSQAGTGVVRASYSAPAATTFLTTQAFTEGGSAPREPCLALSSGFMVALDPHTFAPTNTSSSLVFPMPGMRVGGYYSGPEDLRQTPVVGTLAQGAGPSVIVTDSRKALNRLDPRPNWSMAQPPHPTWVDSGDYSYPVLTDLDGDSYPEIVVQDHPDTPWGSVDALKADGATRLWAYSVVGLLTEDTPFGDANGDGTPDIFFGQLVAGENIYMNVLNGKTGLPLWASGPAPPLEGAVQANAVSDINGDGDADLITCLQNMAYLSGSDGSTIANAGATYYGEPLVSNVMGLAHPQVYCHAGHHAPQLADSTGTTAWVEPTLSPNEHWLGSYAARVTCGTRPLFVHGDYVSPLLHAFDATTGAMVWTEALASGTAYPSPSAIPSGTFAGLLGNVTAKEDLTGQGHVTVLVGSTDGYLYAVQPCAGGALDWSYDFGSAVGEPVVADARGTGKDQVLVTVADGYLYALGNEPMPPTSACIVVDPSGGHPHDVVTTVETASTLSAEWTAVPGATSYQYQVFTSGGSPLESAYTDLAAPIGSAVVDVTATNLSLVDGGRYYFGIRTVGPTGTSSDALSGLVTVSLISSTIDAGTTPTDAGTGAGLTAGSTGGCTVGGDPERPIGGYFVIALAPALLILRRRRAARTRR
jgi:hypothetical protein